MTRYRVNREYEVVRKIDCKSMNCPMPIVTISKAIKGLASGDELVIEANDPAFRADLEAWVNKLGHTLVTFEDGDQQRAVVRKT